MNQLYDRHFWAAYTANVLLVLANALTFRFAELVKALGGSEQLTGSIVSCGMVAAIASRLVIGPGIDRYGTRRLWLASSVFFLLGCIGFIACTTLGIWLYAARVVFAVGIAGMFSCSIVHIQSRVSADRIAEAVGALGTSGFVGMIVGSQLGDFLFRVMPAGRDQYVALFSTATVCGIAYVAIVIWLTARDAPVNRSPGPPIHRLLIRYWPRQIVPVALVMGLGFALTTVFLTRYATQLGLQGLGTFFTSYAVSAFIFRVSTRTWSRTVGGQRMIVMGLIGHATGYALLPIVTTEWHLVLPAIGCGFGHALLFPAVIALGTGSFPRAYRGTGTTIVLGFTEVGIVAGSPVLGWIIDRFGFVPMFFTAATLTVLVILHYAFGPRSLSAVPNGTVRRSIDPVPPSEKSPEESPAAKA